MVSRAISIPGTVLKRLARLSLIAFLSLGAVSSSAARTPPAAPKTPCPPAEKARRKAPAPCKVNPSECPQKPAEKAKPPAPPPKQVTLTDDEALILQLLNAERADHKLPPLKLDPVLTCVAREHCADMAKRGYFSHLDPGPDRRSPLDRYAAALGRPPTEVVGENLGCAEQPIMGMLHECLMKSPDHRANLLDKEYTRVGVGLVVLPDGRTWLTQMFCGNERKAG